MAPQIYTLKAVLLALLGLGLAFIATKEQINATQKNRQQKALGAPVQIFRTENATDQRR